MTPHGPRWTRKVRFIKNALAAPLKWTRPRKIFVNSASDTFHEGFSNEEIGAVFGVMMMAPRHVFQLLTKRADRMPEWFEWLEYTARRAEAVFPDESLGWRRAHCLRAMAMKAGVNPTMSATEMEALGFPAKHIWGGVSVESQPYADLRIPYLLRSPFAVRWLSVEPQLSHVVLSDGALRDGISWVVIGGESGSGARPFHVEWARDLVAQCRKFDVAPFVKQLGKVPMIGRAGAYSDLRRIELKDGHGGEWDEWPAELADLRVREYPTVTA